MKKTKSPNTTQTKRPATAAELHDQAWLLGNMAVRLKIKSDIIRERAQREQLKEMASRALRMLSAAPRDVPPLAPAAPARHNAKRATMPKVKPQAVE